MMFLCKRLNKAYRNKLDAFFEWARTKMAHNDYIEVVLPGWHGFFYFTFPNRGGDKPKQSKKAPMGGKCMFRVIKPDNAQKIGNNTNQQWEKVFFSESVALYEHHSNMPFFRPLRWGVLEREKKEILSFVRKILDVHLTSLENFNLQKEIAGSPLRRMSASIQTVSVAVLLWKDGQLRGFSYAKQRMLSEALSAAAIEAAENPGFKAITHDELGAVRVEVAILHDLHIPLTDSEHHKDILYPEKGYSIKHEGKESIMLPQLLNIKRFFGIKEFLEFIASKEEKPVPPQMYSEAEVSLFEVDDFIERADNCMPITLRGPSITLPNVVLSHADIFEKAHSAADFLLCNQEEDGNFPPIINPITGEKTQVDWARCAFTAWSLALFGKATKEKQYQESARKNFAFLMRFAESNRFARQKNYVLFLAYTGKLALALGEIIQAAEIGKLLERRFKEGVLFDPITYAHSAGLFFSLSENGRYPSSFFLHVAGLLEKRFVKERTANIPLVASWWAELVYVFYQYKPSFACEVADWLASHQLSSGAFATSIASHNSTTSGSGKIFEVLTLYCRELRYENICKHTLTYLFSLQYNDENMFAVPVANRATVKGGIRFNALNQELWIDTIGHLLVGCSRLSASK